MALTMLFFLLGGLTHVDPGEVGILVKTWGDGRGMQKETLSTGTHWVNPWVYDTIVYDTRITQHQMLDVKGAQTSDGQPITLDMTFNVSLDDANVPNLHSRLGTHYWEKVANVADSSIKNHTTTQSSDTVYTGTGRVNIQNGINSDLAQFKQYGINVTANLNDLKFQNHEFVAVLEQKAAAAQLEEINKRNAVAAEQEAIRVENVARGQKLKAIQEAEGRRETSKLEGEGNKLRDEATAAGNLALAKAKAEGLRLENDALSGVGAKYIASMEWAKYMGPNVKIYGVPTGSPGSNTFMFDEAMRMSQAPIASAIGTSAK